jgi:ribonuclease HI
VVHAELWGIIYGLDLAKKKGHKRVHVEFDSMIAINLIRNGCNKEHPAFQLVQAALRITEWMETILWQDTWREANQVADTLAKNLEYSLSLSNNCKIFDQVPGFLVMPLRADFDLYCFP